jgi:hypothetical protein
VIEINAAENVNPVFPEHGGEVSTKFHKRLHERFPGSLSAACGYTHAGWRPVIIIIETNTNAAAGFGNKLTMMLG